jgi:hypothetical protein
MATPLSPRHIFFEALQKQKSEPVKRGYVRWVFTSAGRSPIPERGNDAVKSLSIEEKQKIASGLLAAKRE